MSEATNEFMRFRGKMEKPDGNTFPTAADTGNPVKNERTHPDKDEVGSCGWGRFRPAFLQPFANVWTFVVLYMTFSFTHGLQGAYTIAVLTTLEKRFNLPSNLSGTLVTVANVGYVLSVIFVSFFFAKRHPPRLFAICMLLTSICALLYVIPHFIYGTGNEDIDSVYAQKNDSQKSIYQENSAVVMQRETEKFQLCQEFQNSISDSGGDVCSETQKTTADEEVKFIKPAMVLFALSEILQGVAGAPVWTVGLAYIDDHTNQELSAKLIGVIFTVRFVSPMLSFAMGGYFLSVYADLQETGLNPEHPRWIGAWWLGYLVCFVFNVITCIPTSMIPKNLKPIHRETPAIKETGADEKEVKVTSDAGTKECQSTSTMKDPDDMVTSSEFKKLVEATLRLVLNPIYTLSTIAVCIDCLVFGFMTFLPKYFEVHFQQTAWEANLLGGMIPSIFAGFASYVGGIVSGKVKASDGGVTGNCRLCFWLSLISVFLLVPTVFLSCPDVHFSGELVNYRLNVTTPCNWKCGCPSGGFDPVCGSDGFLYFSPCHAGCTGMANKTTLNASGQRQVLATGCQCVGGGGYDGGSGSDVFSGFCEASCVSLIPYVLVIITVFLAFHAYNVPCTTIILRCSKEEDKSFALGLQTFAICLCIFPAPIIYGSIFESTCILRETQTCSDAEGICLLYDRNAVRLYFHVVTIAFKVISSLFYFLAYLIARCKLAPITETEKRRQDPKMTLLQLKTQTTLVTKL